MSSYASRIAKLETLSDDGQFRFVWLNEGLSRTRRVGSAIWKRSRTPLRQRRRALRAD